MLANPVCLLYTGEQLKRENVREMPYLVQNERIKLSATLFNTLAVASIVVGFITPVATVALDSDEYLWRSIPRNLVATVPGWLVVGGVLHFYARSILGRLRE